MNFKQKFRRKYQTDQIEFQTKLPKELRKTYWKNILKIIEGFPIYFADGNLDEIEINHLKKYRERLLINLRRNSFIIGREKAQQNFRRNYQIKYRTKCKKFLRGKTIEMPMKIFIKLPNKMPKPISTEFRIKLSKKLSIESRKCFNEIS